MDPNFIWGNCGHCEPTVDVCFDLEDRPNKKKGKWYDISSLPYILN